MADQRKFSLPPLPAVVNERASGWAKPLRQVPERLPERPVAPHGLSEAERARTQDALGELLIAIEPQDTKGLTLLLALIDHLIEYYKP